MGLFSGMGDIIGTYNREDLVNLTFSLQDD